MERLSGLYAQALFELATDHNNIEPSLEQALIIRDALTECRQIFIHPHISTPEKHEFLKAIFVGFQPYLLSFLLLTVDKNRETHVIPALTIFIALLKKSLGITVAKVTAAASLPDAQQQQVIGLLESKLNLKVELKTDSDEAVIGGLKIQTNEYYLDRTVRQRLDKLKEGCGA